MTDSQYHQVSMVALTCTAEKECLARETDKTASVADFNSIEQFATMNNRKRPPKPKRAVGEGTNRSLEHAELNRPIRDRHSASLQRGPSTKPSRSESTMEEDDGRPLKPPARTTSLTLQRQEQERFEKIRSKNSANASPCRAARSGSATNHRAVQKQNSNSTTKSDETSTRGNATQSVTSTDDYTVDLVLAKRYAYGKTERSAQQSPSARRVMSEQKASVPPSGMSNKAYKDKMADQDLAGLATGYQKISPIHIRHPDSSPASFASTVVPPPPVLRQQTHFSQPGAFRMSNSDIPHRTASPSLPNTTTRQLPTQQEILEASPVRHRLPDDECPSPPPNMNFTTSMGTYMTAATATTAGPMSVVEGLPMDDRHTLHAFFASRKVKCAICLLFSVFLVLVIGTVYAVTGFGLDQENEYSNSISPTSAPTSIGDLDLDYFVRVALPEQSRESLRKENSPQSKALAWLKNNSLLETYPIDRRLQRFSLATVFFATGGERRWVRNDGWLSNEDECLWYTGQNPETAICREGVYEYLSLGNNQLRGTFPDEIALLPALKVIDLAQNLLTGNMPTTLGVLTSLREIHLYDNFLSGGIPEEIGHLTNLESLDIGFATDFGTAEKLKALDFGQKFASGDGTIPTNLGDLSSLTHVGIEANFISGTLPSQIGYLKSMRELTLGNNTLSGKVPTALFTSCGELRKLDLFQNSFTGSLPAEVGLLTNAQVIYFEKNLFNGNLPSELGLLSNLSTLWLHSNNFRGAIPSEIGRLTKLRDLNLSQNSLTGTLPPSIGLLQDSEFLILSSNSLKGRIPSELGQLSRLRRLALESNSLSGTMPIEVCQLVETGSLPAQNITVDCSLVHCPCCQDCAVSSIQDHS
eukprot:scaffold22577_cov122-Cylindrotheca_fusiformis.AAC.2